MKQGQTCFHNNLNWCPMGCFDENHTDTPEEILKALKNKFPRNHGKTIQVNKAELEFMKLEILTLRKENIELKARLDTNRAQVRAMAEEKQNVCRVSNHVYIDGKCAECGKRRPTQRAADGAFPSGLEEHWEVGDDGKIKLTKFKPRR